MDQTYMINNSNSIDEKAFELFLYNDEVKSKQSEVTQCRERLSQFRQRTKKMLNKHNWQKFFQNSPVEIKKASLFERHLLQQQEVIVTDDESSNSFVSTIEYSFLMMDNPQKELKLQNKAMETPIMNRRSVQKMPSIFNLKKKKLSLENSSLDFKNNFQTPAKKQRLDRQQSITFIADMASTSTPTQNQDKPITSTPKNHSHNPAKYHPTQTIRKKRSKKQPHLKTRTTKPLGSLNLSNLLQEKYIIKHIQNTKKVVSAVSCSNCQQQCNNCTGVKTISYNFLNIDHSTPCQQRFDLVDKEKRSARNKIKKVKVDEVRKYLKKQRTHSAKIAHLATKAKPVSKIGISLEDLIYTPRKLPRTDSFKSSNAVKSSTRLSRVVVTASTPTVSIGSKVYFL